MQWSLRTLRVKLIKIGAKVVKSRFIGITFQMAEVMVSKRLFEEILERIHQLKPETIPENNSLIEVRVTDSVTEEPFSNAQVEFRSTGIAGKATVHTNEEGVAYLVLPSKDSVTLYSCSRSTYQSKKINQEFFLETGQEYHYDIELGNKPGIQGVIVDKQGYPVGGVSLRMVFGKMEPENFTTIADGKFKVTYNSGASKNELYGSNKSLPCLIFYHKRRNLAASIKIGKDFVKEAEIVLKPAVTVEGIVKDPEGKPLEGAVVEVRIWIGGYDKLDCGRKAKTNSEGYYSIKGLAPLPDEFSYYLNFEKGNYFPQSTELEELVPGETIIRDKVISKKRNDPKTLLSNSITKQ